MIPTDLSFLYVLYYIYEVVNANHLHCNIRYTVVVPRIFFLQHSIYYKLHIVVISESMTY